AAGGAYENLKPLLHRHFADPPQASLEGGPTFEAAPTLTALPSRASQMNLAFALRHPPMAPRLPGGSLHAADHGPRRLDIRGFLAGVAVSAAIGAAPYICLAAGERSGRPWRPRKHGRPLRSRKAHQQAHRTP